MSNFCKAMALIVTITIPHTLFSQPPNAKFTNQGAHPGFNPRRTSIMIADARNGQELAGHLPDLTLNPASCAKIITSAAALSILGPEYRFETGFYTDTGVGDGKIGTLYIKGTGDPMFVNEDIQQIAHELYFKGLRRIANGIVVDNSHFDSYRFPHKETGQGRAYTAKTSATAVNFNSIQITAQPGGKVGAPGTITLNPPADYFKVINKLVTGGKFRLGISLGTSKDGETISVVGRIPLRAGAQEFYRSVSDPALYAGSVVKYWLEETGITVAGPIRASSVPNGARVLHTWKSPTLADIVKGMNKKSLNFIAEQILKHIGSVKYGAPGSTAKGIRVVGEYLESIGIPRGTYTLENGSGLSDISRVSARQLVRVLVTAYRDTKIRDALMQSFSLLGVDGTTKGWNVPPDLDGKALVKTGTVAGVSTLAGYATMSNGETAAFAILANDLPRGVPQAHKAEIAVVRAILESSPPL